MLLFWLFVVLLCKVIWLFGLIFWTDVTVGYAIFVFVFVFFFFGIFMFVLFFIVVMFAAIPSLLAAWFAPFPRRVEPTSAGINPDDSLANPAPAKT